MDNPKVIPLDSDLARKMAQVEKRKEFLTKSYASRREIFPDPKHDNRFVWGMRIYFAVCISAVIAFVWYFADKV